MSYELIAMLMFSSMMLLLLTGKRVFGAIGFVAAAAALLLWGDGGSEMAFSAAMKLMKWYPLLTLPMFVFMGYMLSESGIAEDLYKMFHVWMGPLPGGLERVHALMQHEAFTLKNPNKVRALIGAFANQNLVNFHRADGAGYRFLADQVITLNALNPQIASRLLAPLTRWRKYDGARQALMKGELERILASGELSSDVYEVVSKSLA